MRANTSNNSTTKPSFVKAGVSKTTSSRSSTFSTPKIVLLPTAANLSLPYLSSRTTDIRKKNTRPRLVSAEFRAPRLPLMPLLPRKLPKKLLDNNVFTPEFMDGYNKSPAPTTAKAKQEVNLCYRPQKILGAKLVLLSRAEREERAIICCTPAPSFEAKVWLAGPPVLEARTSTDHELLFIDMLPFSTIPRELFVPDDF
jgi:hypothetical protein